MLMTRVATNVRKRLIEQDVMKSSLTALYSDLTILAQEYQQIWRY